MTTIQISVKDIIAFLNKSKSPHAFFRQIPLEQYLNATINGKTISFSLTDHADYQFTYRSLSDLMTQYISGKLTTVQFKFLLEVISLLSDDWIFEEGVLEVIISLSLSELKR